MAIIILKAWYLESVLSVAQMQTKAPDLRLSRTGLLKTGMRADLLNELDDIKGSQWFQRYLEGEMVEFYIEGSGAYSISNLDLISREMYFTKRSTLTYRDPVILFCGQGHYPASSQAISKSLTHLMEAINRKPGLVMPIHLEQTMESAEGNYTIDAAVLRKLKQSLLVIADVTPVATFAEGTSGCPSPQVCVELGYALQTKQPEEIMLIQFQRDDYSGRFPFDIDNSSYHLVKDPKDLDNQLADPIIKQLQRAHVFSS
jgi:hypothetical protein